MSKQSPALRATRRRMTADERRLQISTEAAMLFDDAGYTNATMDDIARRVGVAKPTIYHYFESKDDILLAIHESFIDLLITRHAQRATTGRAPEQLLLEIMVDVLDLMETHRGHVRVFFEHHRLLSPEAQASIRVKRDSYERTVEDLFSSGVRRGAFRPLEPSLAALATFGMCNWAYQWYQKGGDLRPRQIAEQFWQFLVCGIGTPLLVETLDPPVA